jgi:hypothetical protein
MSKVTIQGDASGTGIFTIASPNSNTDRTLVLPDEAGTVLTTASDLTAGNLTGSVPTSAMPAGSVLQMVYAVVDASAEVQLSTGGTWDTATVTITPTFANSTIALFHNPYKATEYQRQRAQAYPSMADQLDTIYHEGIDAWKAQIAAVKQEYPKL